MLGMKNVLGEGYAFIGRSFLKVEMDKKLVVLSSISLSRSKRSLCNTFNVSISIYLEMTFFLRCIRNFSDDCNTWQIDVTVKKGYGFFRNLVMTHLIHFTQVFFIPVFANRLTKSLTPTRGFYCCWAFKKQRTGGRRWSKCFFLIL